MKLRLFYILMIFISISTFSQTKTKDDKFEFSADKTAIELSDGKEYTILNGNAKISSSNTQISANKIELYGKSFRYAMCSGTVRVKDSKKGIYLKCENMFFDRIKKISRIEGYAEMVDKANNLVVKGNFLEDSQDSDMTLIQIGVRIIKDNIVCRSEAAIYNRKTKELELSGSPYVIKGEDEYRATKIIINIDTDEIKLEGRVKGTIRQEEKQ